MSTWFVASNITPGDNSGIDMVPNPGDYTSLVTGDNCMVMHNGTMQIYQYNSTSAVADDGFNSITPDGNAGNGRWIRKDVMVPGQNGFPIPLGPDPDSNMTFTDGTRTFEITPAVDEFSIIVQGFKFLKTSAESVVITDVHGLHWIYYDEHGVLQVQAPGSSTDDLILYNCLVANVYWDATNNESLLFGEERHGSSMSPATHYHLHEVQGSQYETGLGLSGFDIDGSGADATAAQFDVNSGEFHDEDIEISIETILNATIDTYYREGVGGNWFKAAATTNYPVADGSVGDRLDWNDYNGGTWQRDEVPNRDFVLTHYFATNHVIAGTGIIGIMGQNVYINATQARTGAEVELLSISLAGLPSAEWIPIASVIWQTNDTYTNQVAARLRSTDLGDDYIDWRSSRVFSGGGSSTVDHESLAGLLGGAAADHYHITSAQHTGLTGAAVTNLHKHDIIDAGDSNVTVTDVGSGDITIAADGNEEVSVTDAGLRLGGANSRVSAILDEDDMASDSATSIATQQSIKAYVRDNAGDPALPKIDFYQDWLQETKYLNSTVLTMVDSADTLVNAGNTNMDFNIETKQYDFTTGEIFETVSLFDSDLSITNVAECIVDISKSTYTGTIEVTNDGSTWVEVTDTTQVVTFATSGVDLRLRYTAAATGTLNHMGVLYNPDTIYAPATEVVLPTDNVIINGDFSIWQRGTSFAAIADDDYSADRFIYSKSGAMVHTITQDTSVPTIAESDQQSPFSMKVDCTTIDAAIAAADYCFLSQRIEGSNVAMLLGGSVALSFWVKATKVGIYCVTLRNIDGTKQYISEYTINTTDTWEKQTIIINMADAGSFTLDDTRSLDLDFVLAAGTDFHGTADTWESTLNLSTSNQVNACDSTDNNFYLSQIKLEKGGVATPFKSRHFGDELALCQRYYHRITGQWSSTGQAYGSANRTYGNHIDFPATMRSTPTFAYSQLSDFHLWEAGTASKVLTAMEAHKVNPNGCGLRADASTATLVNGNAVVLECQQNAGYIDFDAEL